jgi:protein TonB
MFEDSLVESAALLRSRNHWPALLSITSQCAIAVLIVSLPVLHPELLPMPHIVPATLVPPRAPAPPPPELPHTVPRVSAALPPITAPPTTRVQQDLFKNLRPPGPETSAPTLGEINLSASNPSLPIGSGSAPAAPRVRVGTPSAATKAARVRLSSGVSAGLLLAPMRPEYPAIARAAHVGGTIVIEAIISRTGSIEDAQVTSGPAMLRSAALAAVRQARYRPFLLNGQQTEVQTTITVIFRLGS